MTADSAHQAGLAIDVDATGLPPDAVKQEIQAFLQVPTLDTADAPPKPHVAVYSGDANLGVNYDPKLAPGVFRVLVSRPEVAGSTIDVNSTTPSADAVEIVPVLTAKLQFNLRSTLPAGPDQLKVDFGGESLGTIDLDATGTWRQVRLDLPDYVRGQGGDLTFALVNKSGIAQISNVQFLPGGFSGDVLPVQPAVDRLRRAPVQSRTERVCNCGLQRRSSSTQGGAKHEADRLAALVPVRRQRLPRWLRDLSDRVDAAKTPFEQSGRFYLAPQ